jgi:hypothetical protein
VIHPNELEVFVCKSCGRPGKVEMERGFLTGQSGIIREVRVEYDFDRRTGRYRGVAIVRDESLPSGLDVYTRRSPLTRSEKSALSLAEALLLELNRCHGPFDGNNVPRAASFMLSFDDDVALFRQSLRDFAAAWRSATEA